MKNNERDILDIDPFDDNAADFLDFNIEACLEKGYRLYEEGNYEEAAKFYLAALKHNITDASSIYILASLYGLLGKAELSAKFLEKAVMAGFEEIPHIEKNDAFKKVREDEGFERTLHRITEYIKKREEDRGEVVYFDSSAIFKCLVRFLDGHDPQKKQTLVIGLHGRGNTPEEFITIWQDAGISPDFIFAAPQAHYPFLFNNKVGYSWNLRAAEDVGIFDTTSKMSIGYIAETVLKLSERLPAGDVYLLGFSQGASFALQVGLRHYRNLRGILSFSGFLPTDFFESANFDPDAAKSLRIFLAHGSRDKSIPLERSKAIFEQLDGYNFDVTFVEFDDVHTLPPDVVVKAYDWLREEGR